MFVAPDDSDDEDLHNCDVEHHLKYKFLTEEIEHNRRMGPNHSSSSDVESIRRIKDRPAANGGELADGADTASIDSNLR